MSVLEFTNIFLSKPFKYSLFSPYAMQASSVFPCCFNYSKNFCIFYCGGVRLYFGTATSNSAKSKSHKFYLPFAGQ